MCGICGELRFDAHAVDPLRVQRMQDKIMRRGPDSEGQYIRGPIGLGHRRLAIIDLSDRGHQPMVDEALGLVLVFNGTIYNYKILRQQLIDSGYQFFSDSDSEVIIKAYHAWGDACVERLHGMFAFAVWNIQTQTLFLARDRLGIKPLYFTKTAKAFWFASTPQALLSTGQVDTAIDVVGLHHQLTLHAVIPAPRTILQGIRKVAPATTLQVDKDGQVTEQRYWTLVAQRQAEYTEQEWIDRIRVGLQASIKRRKDIADVPVGILLSGGLDSSLLVALLVEAGVDDLQTFSIGFDDIGEEKGSEFEFSDLVVARYQTQHHKIQVANSEVLKRLPEAVSHMAEPMVGQDAVAFYLLAERVSQHVKVVQSGQGADEVFAGYFWYPQMQAAIGSDVDRFGNHYFDRSHQEYLASVGQRYQTTDHTSVLISDLLDQSLGQDYLDKVLHMDVTTLVVDDPVKRVDNMTMAWGLEARVPFLDHELVEIAAQMPPQLKLKENGKYPLKQIARGLLPDAVIDRPKGYFPMPALKYVQGEYHDFMQSILLSDACRQRQLFANDYVAKLLKAPEKHMTKLNGSKLWHLALLELWLQQHVDDAV